MPVIANQTGSVFGNVPGLAGPLGRSVTPAGMVQFASADGASSVTAWLRAESWAVDTGDGSIDRVEIPGRTARTVWRGRSPVTMQGDIRFDRGITRAGTRVSVEADCRNLDVLQGRGAAGTPREPATLMIDANGALAYDARWQPDVRWWIEAVQWATEPGPDGVVRRGDFHRVLQVATVKVVQVARGPVTVAASSGTQARDRLIRDTRLTHTVKQGETLRTIAKRYYGRTGAWEDIARLNNISHPSGARVGRVLRLPS